MKKCFFGDFESFCSKAACEEFDEEDSFERAILEYEFEGVFSSEEEFDIGT